MSDRDKFDKHCHCQLIFSCSSEHSNDDFQHNNPILAKKKSSFGGKHRKVSEDKSGKGMKKASTASAQLQGIPEGQILAEEETGGNTKTSPDADNESTGLIRPLHHSLSIVFPFKESIMSDFSKRSAGYHVHV